MSAEQGYIRVVNVRGDEDFCPLPSERLVMVDRTNKVLGNKHVMKVKSRLERERVIEAFRKDIEADIAHGGSMSQVLMEMAKDIVNTNVKIAAGCWCAGAACHGDVIAEKVREMVVVLREERELKAQAPKESAAHLPAAPKSKP